MYLVGMAKNNIAIVILAAGKGTRMKSSKPKVLHEIAGVPMITYVLSNVAGLKPDSISVVIGPDMKDVSDEVKDWDKNIKSVVQKDQNGTGDAVKQARHLKNFKGTVIVLFADTPFITEYTLAAMVDELNYDSKTALVVLGFTPEDAAEYGRLIVDNGGKLRAIKEFRDADEAQQQIQLCNAGVMAIRGDILFKMLEQLRPDNSKGELYLTDLVSIARKDGYQCSVIEADENEVMGINSRDQLSHAESVVQQYLRWDAMDGGATLIAPDTVYMCHDTRIGEDVTIHPNVVIGPGVTISDDVEIKSFTHIEGAFIEPGSVIGPYARLRPGTVIGEDSKVGNFVEVKNAVFGKGVKAGHLSYIGDTDIGDETNIGAGTVTCNYDGKKKHKTYIGKKAFIGSNSSLVAPIRVGDAATIGAGSTITKDVADKTTVVNDTPQKEIKKRKK
jgi:bifunctional UDP-N-acetylglucosamine pyrophosphorylase/glucosamine-1-phosphate N-acetyltransferase